MSAYDYTIGVDEVGTGALAGPAFVCAVVVPRDWPRPQGLKDSKKMSWGGRSNMYRILLEQVTAHRIISIPSAYIDEVGLRKAWLDGVDAALIELVGLYPSGNIIVDGDTTHPNYKRMCAVIKADNSVPAVSAASVIAKVNRDMLMRQLHEEYPYYDWKNNVGYGSKAHFAGLNSNGVSPHHRRSYAPIRRLLPDPPAPVSLVSTVGDFTK